MANQNKNLHGEPNNDFIPESPVMETEAASAGTELPPQESCEGKCGGCGNTECHCEDHGENHDEDVKDGVDHDSFLKELEALAKKYGGTLVRGGTIDVPEYYLDKCANADTCAEANKCPWGRGEAPEKQEPDLSAVMEEVQRIYQRLEYIIDILQPKPLFGHIEATELRTSKTKVHLRKKDIKRIRNSVVDALTPVIKKHNKSKTFQPTTTTGVWSLDDCLRFKKHLDNFIRSGQSIDDLDD